MNSIPQIEAKHTPGPWAVHGEWITRADEIAESGKNEYGYQSGHYVAHVVEPIGGRLVCEANARLIAAAPETAAQRDQLLAACRDLLDAFWDMSPLEYARSRGMNSMSDAEGERIKERARAAVAQAKAVTA